MRDHPTFRRGAVLGLPLLLLVLLTGCSAFDRDQMTDGVWEIENGRRYWGGAVEVQGVDLQEHAGRLRYAFIVMNRADFPLWIRYRMRYLDDEGRRLVSHHRPTWQERRIEAEEAARFHGQAPVLFAEDVALEVRGPDR